MQLPVDPVETQQAVVVADIHHTVGTLRHGPILVTPSIHGRCVVVNRRYKRNVVCMNIESDEHTYRPSQERYSYDTYRTFPQGRKPASTDR